MSEVVRKVAKRGGRQGPFLRFGVPLLSLVVLGYAAMGHLLQGRREVVQAKDDEEWERLAAARGMSKEGPLSPPSKRKSVSLKEELDELRRKVDIDAYDYKPVPKLKDPS